ncbi:MAG: AmmeMemoRadiSam system protein B [Kiritimatiellia bacterium]
MRTADVYVATGAGRWYPADAGALQSQIAGFVNSAAVDIIAAAGAGSACGAFDAPLLGGIAPHAGLDYSGRVAGYTYAALRASAQQFGMPDVVLVLGFSHRPAADGLAILAADSIQTPMGMLRTDRAVATALLRGVPGGRFDTETHMGEHSSENQLPFLQYALPDVPVVAALVCGHAPSMLAALGDAIVALQHDQHVVCIASTDLLHDPSYDKVCQADTSTLARLERLDSDGLNRAWSYGHQVCCGIGPVQALIHGVRKMGCRSGRVLFYENSGDVDPAGRGSWVVGYGAVVYPAAGNRKGD